MVHPAGTGKQRGTAAGQASLCSIICRSELRAMAEQLGQRLALLGCELTIIFHDAENWEGCQHLGQAGPDDGRPTDRRSAGVRPGAVAALRYCCGLIC